MISKLWRECNLKSFHARFFLGASQDENVAGFPLRSDEWKNLMMGKTNI